VLCHVPAFRDIIGLEVNNFGLTFNNQNGHVGGVNERDISTARVYNPWEQHQAVRECRAFRRRRPSLPRHHHGECWHDIADCTKNLYSVKVLMTRKTGATCNPRVQAAFVQEVIP
jgi:hypothetical protein